ncbi:hypothetical protein [Trujillonella endophytica]|uniref:hypothetical protein n=1 Tax=Trujillonella endophytica TaxID=673521 RepID=UPI001B8AE521|nr:hypothetical protein [Trujillella endophytica]
MPDADDFRALARSSPWRFTTVRFTSRRGPSGDAVRAWLRRPDALRVETIDGALLGVVHGRSHTTSVVLGAGPGDPPPEAPPPVLRVDGLVAVRPWDADRADDPMWQDYRWVAMLDPVELADGQARDGDTGEPAGPPLTIGTVREVDHGGRPAWEAVVATTDTYDPCCSCCPLLHDAGIDRLEWDDAGERFAGSRYPSATRVRLDVGTGVCVLTEALDGTWAGDGHEVLIEAVDEPMDDDLFVEPPRAPSAPRWGYSPAPGPGRA